MPGCLRNVPGRPPPPATPTPPAPARAGDTIEANLRSIRAGNQVTAGAVTVPYTVTPALNPDVLMETGTARRSRSSKRCTRLHQRYRLSKFIVLVPTNAIRQGTSKVWQTTAAFLHASTTTKRSMCSTT